MGKKSLNYENVIMIMLASVCSEECAVKKGREVVVVFYNKPQFLVEHAVRKTGT
jgi:hypothetical protein